MLILFFSILMLNTVVAGDNYTDHSTANATFDSIQSLIDNAEAGDSIHLDNKTYFGNGSSVNINKDINIYGDDDGNTVLDAQSKSKIFIISNKVKVNIYGITFIHGHTDGVGSAIDNLGFLTVYDSKFLNNSADYGAVRGSAGSSLTIYNSLFENNYGDGGGAAIDSFESETKVINCTFVKNWGHEGGAIYNRFSNFQLIDSYFLNNSGTRGAGIYNNRGYLTVRNSKFYSNIATDLGGGIKSWGICDIYDCDVRNNSGRCGGGIYISDFTMHVKNTIIDNNNAVTGGGLIAHSFGTLVIENSTVSNNRAEQGGGISSDNGYLNASDCIFENNVATYKGGGISSAVGHFGDDIFTCNLKRIILNNNSAKSGGGLCFSDIIGNFEEVYLNNNSATEGGAIYNEGDLTFNRFSINSNHAVRGGAIYNKGTINLTNSLANLNFADNGGFIYNLADFNSFNSDLNYNSAKGYGGAVYNLGNVILVNSDFNYNSAEHAGVIYNIGKSCSIYGSSFEYNKAEQGAVISTDADVSIQDSRFEKNLVLHTFGVIFILNGNINIANSIFNLNTGSDESGVIFNSIDGVVLINNSQFLSNNAKSHGGAIDNSGKLTIANSLFDNNDAYGAGAIDNGGSLTIINSKFTNNKATKNGGAIDNNDKLNIIGSIFDNNVAGGEGGAIIARKEINLTHSGLFNNKAGVGDAIYANNNCSNLTDNWWGSNNPNFNELLNFNVCDNFTWIVMDVKDIDTVMQYENPKIMFSLNEVKNKSNMTSKLNFPESLPNFEVTLSTGEKFVVEDGYLLKSVYVPQVKTLVATCDNQSFSFDVLSNPSKIVNNMNVVEDYKGKTTFKVRVIGIDGKFVSENVVVIMKIGSRSYNVKTDKNGYATKTFSLVPGKYTIITIYKGCTVKNTIKINKVLKAKNKSVKKSKKIKYSAILKTSKGKAIKGKKIKFIVRGKTYSAKTNKKGIATVKIKNLKLGKNKITVKYLESQVKTTINVKK